MRAETPNHTDQEKELAKILAPFLATAQRVSDELEPLARRYKVIGEEESFPKHMATRLKEELVSGMFDWAVRKMGKDLERYLEEGRRNYSDHFKLLLFNPYRDGPRGGKEFLDSFEKAEFFIPLSFGRKEVHHEDWPEIDKQYKKILPEVQGIWRKTSRNFTTRKLKLAETFSLSKQIVEELFDAKPSEIALEIVRRKLRLRRITTEALRKYIRRVRSQYNYLDYIFDNLQKIKASRYSLR